MIFSVSVKPSSKLDMAEGCSQTCVTGSRSSLEQKETLTCVGPQVRMYSRALAVIGGFLVLASGAGEVYRQKPRSRSLQSTGQVFLGVYLICMVSPLDRLQLSSLCSHILAIFATDLGAMSVPVVTSHLSRQQRV